MVKQLPRLVRGHLERQLVSFEWQVRKQFAFAGSPFVDELMANVMKKVRADFMIIGLCVKDFMRH